MNIAWYSPMLLLRVATKSYSVFMLSVCRKIDCIITGNQTVDVCSASELLWLEQLQDTSQP